MTEHLAGEGCGTRSNSAGGPYGYWVISPNGTLSADGQPSLYGVMNNSKDALASVMNDGGGGYDMFISIKRKYYSLGDVNQDKRIGIDDAIYVLQILSGMRVE
jgi:hypothetical protein